MAEKKRGTYEEPFVGAIELEDMSSSINEDHVDENKKRGNWSNKMDFILSCLGFAVGLGNVWRFPYLCYSNGGGAFLIPYAIFLFFAGLPIFYLELSLGQFASMGCTGVWKLSPIFRGLGFGMVIITGLVCIYYNVIICWIVYYFIASFTKIPSLPWVGCDNWWNNDLCFDGGNNTNVTGGMMVINGTNVTMQRPSQQYFDRFILRRSDGIDDSGSIIWQNALCLLFAWIIVYLCIIKGIKSSGKIVYFTVTFPYIILTILLVRGVTLPGSLDGIKFYMVPDWERLKHAKVWKDAATQIFYSLGVAWGGLHTMASYNKFHNNCHSDAIIVSLLNCGTSIFAGFVIFSVLGFMAYDMGVPIAEVATSGQGLAFVAYPEAIARLPISPLWAVLFFFMLFTLGLDSQFVMIETAITAFFDELSYVVRKKRMVITAAICFLWYLMGLPCVLNSGVYWVALFDWYSAGFSLLIIGILECLVICYVYGINNFCDDVQTMVGFSPNIYWKACWMLISPCMLGFILIFSFISYSPATYGDYVFPVWAEIVGWAMVLLALTPLCVCAVMALVAEDGSLWQRIKKATRPHKDWGPALNKHRIEAGYDLLLEDASVGKESYAPNPHHKKGLPMNGVQIGVFGYVRPGADYLYPASANTGVQCDM